MSEADLTDEEAFDSEFDFEEMDNPAAEFSMGHPDCNDPVVY